MTEDLTDIDGVGDAIAEQLRDAGYDTVADVLAASVDDLEATIPSRTAADVENRLRTR